MPDKVIQKFGGKHTEMYQDENGILHRFPVSENGPELLDNCQLPNWMGKKPDYINFLFAGNAAPIMGLIIPNASYQLQPSVNIWDVQSGGVGSDLNLFPATNMVIPTWCNFWDTNGAITPFDRTGLDIAQQSGLLTYSVEAFARIMQNRTLKIERAELYYTNNGNVIYDDFRMPVHSVNMAVIQQNIVGGMMDNSGAALYFNPQATMVIEPTIGFFGGAYSADCEFYYHSGTTLMLTFPALYTLLGGNPDEYVLLRLKVKSQHNNLINFI